VFEEFKSAFSKYNNSHVQLILINVVVYLFMVILVVLSTWASMPGASAFFDFLFSIPPKFADFIVRPWTVITYAFAHSLNPLHILFNMLFLYWFGKLFIEYLGSEKLIAVYVLGALAGALFYLLMFNVLPFFIDRAGFSGMVGASAAVFCVMVATAALLPDYTFYLLFLGPVKIKYIALFFIVASLVGSIGENDGGNLAHLGGALMGFVYTKQLQIGVNWGGWITATLTWFKGLFQARPKVKVTYRKDAPKKSAAASNFGKATQEEIDAILDKISEQGYEKLTKDEKDKLFNASKK
jgi:membrane associated rhomboid family serine protease